MEEEEILGMVFSRVMASSSFRERELGEGEGGGWGTGLPELPGIIVLYLRLRVSFVILGQCEWVAMILSRYQILSQINQFAVFCVAGQVTINIINPY